MKGLQDLQQLSSQLQTMRLQKYLKESMVDQPIIVEEPAKGAEISDFESRHPSFSVLFMG